MRRLLVVVLVAISMWSCGTDKGPTPPSSIVLPPLTVTSPDGNVLTATIDGAAFNGMAVLAFKFSNTADGSQQLIGIGGSNFLSEPFRDLQIAFPAAIGTHTLDSLAIPGASLSVQHSPSDASPMIWTTFRPDASGTITVTSLTSSSASGTFSLVLQPLTATGATGAITVTNGVFDVTLSALPLLPHVSRSSPAR
jgi:hypothetical protein